MNVNAKILKLEDVTGYPVAPDLYEGSAEKRIVFSYTDERGSLYGDDTEQLATVSLNIVLYTPAAFNYFEDKKKIKNALIQEGFSVDYIQSFLQDTLTGTDRVRQTIFHATFTGVDE